jgi:hypothetical protein
MSHVSVWWSGGARFRRGPPPTLLAVIEFRRIRPGLWRWTASHPGWAPDAPAETPSDWPRDVGSVLCETAEATVLIDPLLPPEREAFLRRLDKYIGSLGLPVVVLTTLSFHRRSRDLLAERYDASTSRARRALPGGVEALPIRGAGETMFWLSDHRALVAGDRIIGAPGGGLRICPESWLGYLSSGIGIPELRERLRPLLELPIETVLVSHGEPVLRHGRAALAEALG